VTTPTHAGADLRVRLPPVRDQGQRGTCVAFAVTAAHELSRASGSAVAENLSEEALFWGCKIADGNWDSGTRLSSASTAISATGQPLEAVWPYVPHRVTGIRYDPPTAPSSEWRKSGLRRSGIDRASIRAELTGDRAVVLGLTVFDTMFRPTTAGRVEAPPAGSSPRGRHAVLAVGYDDVRGVLIRNSWGSTWALRGYAWLSHEYTDRHVHEAWVVQPQPTQQVATSQTTSTGDIYELDRVPGTGTSN
jgi:C1A family cysteine protease